MLKSKKLYFLSVLFLFFALTTQALAASIELNYPNGLEELTAGQSYDVSWDQEGLSQVAVSLMDKDNSQIGSTAYVDVDPATTTASYSFGIPLGTNGIDYYKFQVVGTPEDQSEEVSDESDDYFSVMPGVELTLLTDLTSSTNPFVLGNSYQLEWSYTDDLTYDTYIRLYQDGSELGEIASTSAGTNIFNWDLTYTSSTLATTTSVTAGDNYQLFLYADTPSEAYPIEKMSENFSVYTNADDSGDDEGDDEDDDTGKVLVCHLTGNGKSHTISIAEPAWPAHEAHGDTLGACGSEESDDEGDSSEESDDDTLIPVQTKARVNARLTNRLKGKILLQVENHGEAWYVRPDNGRRMYMKDGETAYGMMRNLGLGISNADLAKIPVGLEKRFECGDSDGDGLCDKMEEGLGTDPYDTDSDDDGYDDATEVTSNFNPLGQGGLSIDNNLVNRIRGRIVLQVQSHGEAWYINPDDGKRYYMTDGDAAYQIMRFLSLGITNSDLEQIETE